MNLCLGWMGVVRTIVLSVAGAAAFGDAVIAQEASGQQDKPNIILFYTDDQGWADTSVPMMAGRPDSRSSFIRTPHLAAR